MISVIIPVYNVAPYLGKCLESVINQTYTDLEIIVVDDGSTDNSGAICEEYKKKDGRIRVFHTENRGLSCARNLGLDEAQGEWIGFVDSDDWLEPDMYELLLKKAEEAGADIVECGIFRECPEKTTERKSRVTDVSGNEALSALLQGKIAVGVMNKLWRSSCFAQVRFPEGRVYEDIATTYRVLAAADRVQGIEAVKYHYRSREGSITKTCSMKNLTDLWMAQTERFLFLKDKLEGDSRDMPVRLCSKSAVKMWVYYYSCPKEERREKRKMLREMSDFIRENVPLFGMKKWNTSLRIGVFFTHFPNAVSLRTAWLLYKVRNAFAISENRG